MRIRRWSDELPNDLEHLGFAIHEDQGRHIGVLYHLDDGITKFCHLGWNWSLTIDLPSTRYFWGKSGLEPSEKKFLAAYFDLVGKANPDTIPYGISVSGKCFDEYGNGLPLPIGKGMTCASFIVNVFKALEIPLLDEASWPKGRARDQEWGRMVVKALEDDPKVPREHVDAVKKDIDQACRFRPCEVAAALLSDEPPVKLTDIEALAEQILFDIQEAKGEEMAFQLQQFHS